MPLNNLQEGSSTGLKTGGLNNIGTSVSGFLLTINDTYAIPSSVTYQFQSFDTNVWTVYDDANYDSTNEYVNMVNGSEDNGELEFDSGVSLESWFCEWDNINESGNYEFQAFMWYNDTVSRNSNSEGRFDDINTGYYIEVRYDGDIRLYEIENGSGTNVATGGTTTEDHTYRMEWDNGSVRFLVDGTEELSHTFSSPNTQYNKTYFKSVTGSNGSTNHIDNVTIGTL